MVRTSVRPSSVIVATSAQRQMGSGQRNSQALCGKHHDREVNFTLLREKFRMTGKGMPASSMPLCTGPVTSA